MFQILSWEFCARRHEELLPRRLVAPQVWAVWHYVCDFDSLFNISGENLHLLISNFAIDNWSVLSRLHNKHVNLIDEFLEFLFLLVVRLPLLVN